VANSDAFKSALYGAVMAELGGPYRKSYTATGWHAQISKLTSSDRGYQAAAAAGLSVSAKQLTKWLAEEVEPRPDNRAKIARAYSIMRGEWTSDIEGKTVEITGDVSIKTDTRDRTFRIYSGPGSGPWRDLKRKWESGELDADWLTKTWLYALIEDDIGEMSDPPEFTGPSYTVVLT
jgi:hypothetical protein